LEQEHLARVDHHPSRGAIVLIFHIFLILL